MNNIKKDKQADMLKNWLDNEVEKGELNKQSTIQHFLFYVTSIQIR